MKSNSYCKVLGHILLKVRTHLRNLLSLLMSQNPDVANSLLKASWAPYGDGHPVSFFLMDLIFFLVINLLITIPEFLWVWG